jgi:hypothetical protein
MSDPIPCTAAERPCAAPAECRHAGICLGSDDGVRYQETRMRAFFEWILPQFAEKER